MVASMSCIAGKKKKNSDYKYISFITEKNSVTITYTYKLLMCFQSFKYEWILIKCKNLHLFQCINKEEGLLDKEQSQFPILQTIMAKKQPYDQLWITALDFQTKSDVWMNGKAHAVIFLDPFYITAMK